MGTVLQNSLRISPSRLTRVSPLKVYRTDGTKWSMTARVYLFAQSQYAWKRCAWTRLVHGREGE